MGTGGSSPAIYGRSFGGRPRASSVSVNVDGLKSYYIIFVLLFFLKCHAHVVLGERGSKNRYNHVLRYPCRESATVIFLFHC